MSTNFPASLDALTNPTATTSMSDAALSHSSQHSNLNDAVEAIQAKIGVTGSAVTTTHDYRLATLESGINARNYATLALADAAAVSAGKSLIISTSIAVDADLTVASPTLILKSGLLTVASTKTLTFTLQPDIGMYQVFAGDGAVAGLKEAYPEWFGTNTTPGTTNMAGSWTKGLTSLSSGGTLITHGTYKILSGITMPNNTIIKGIGYNHNADTTGATTIIKDGDFAAITMGYDCGIEKLLVDGETANGGGGIYMPKGRSYIRDVGVVSQGGNGIRIGSDVAADNASVWSLQNVFTVGNTGHGVYIHHASTNPALPDANAGILTGLDTRANGGDGIRIAQAIDNKFYGITSQLNAGWGIQLMEYAKGNKIDAPYMEANTLGNIQFNTGADANYLFGLRSGETAGVIVDSGATNYILGKTNYVVAGTPYYKGVIAFDSPVILNEAISGYWKAAVNGSTRNLDISLLGTGSTGGLTINGGSPLKKILRAGATLNFGTIAAGAEATATITVTGAAVNNFVIAAPYAALPSGIVVSYAYVSATDTVTIVLHNYTGAGVAVNQAFAAAYFSLF